jgi:hypothetical protein
VGALLHGVLQSAVLTGVFAALLVFAGTAGVTGVADRMRFRGPLAWAAGTLSGLFGGLVGNQGGIRSAAMLCFDIRRDAFVGTATAVGLFVDGVRLPAYLITGWEEIARSVRATSRPHVQHARVTAGPAVSVDPDRGVTGGNLIWKDRPSSVFFRGPAPSWSGVIPEGADVGSDEAASTTNQADMRGLPGAEPHDRGSSGAASV